MWSKLTEICTAPRRLGCVPVTSPPSTSTYLRPGLGG